MSKAAPDSKTSPVRTFSKLELVVARELSAAGWTFLFHDVEIFGVQIDLLMRRPCGLLCVVEVKTQGRSGLAHLGWRQRLRLGRVVTFLAGFEPVELQLALVEFGGESIRLLPVD